jgi:hypothetical protein
MNGPDFDELEKAKGTSMDQTAKSQEIASAARRRMLKLGAAALPAAMTLHSGAVQAMTSITCGIKSKDSSNTAPCLTNYNDGWMRLPCDVYSQKTWCKDLYGKWGYQSSSSAYYYKGSCNGLDQWRYCSNNQLVGCSDQPKDCGDKVGSKLGLVQIDCTDGHIVACGAPCGSIPNCIITSAAGNCMHSLQQQAKW